MGSEVMFLGSCFLSRFPNSPSDPHFLPGMFSFWHIGFRGHSGHLGSLLKTLTLPEPGLLASPMSVSSSFNLKYEAQTQPPRKTPGLPISSLATHQSLESASVERGTQADKEVLSTKVRMGLHLLG